MKKWCEVCEIRIAGGRLCAECDEHQRRKAAIRDSDRGLPVMVELEEVDLEGDYGYVEGVKVRCLVCGAEGEAFGTTDKSRYRALHGLNDVARKKGVMHMHALPR